MAADLADLKRLKITPETRAFLQARSRATGKSFQEIARDVLHEIAVQQIHEANVLVALATAEGHSRASGGRK